jgi:hypothetical protein
MMDLLPPVGWADVARRQDIDQVGREMHRRFDELPQLFATKDDLRAQTNRYIGWMLTCLTAQFACFSLLVSVLVLFD